MASKFFTMAAFVVVARVGVLSAAPSFGVAATPVLAKVSDATFDPNPQYSFAYDVQDTLTGDSKSQIESRNGDIVQGQYSLVDPDGTRRIVDYTADPINGFNAVVRRTPLAVAAPVVARAVAAPVIAAQAPVLAARSFAPAPVAVAAPAQVVAARGFAPAPVALAGPGPVVDARAFPAHLAPAPGHLAFAPSAFQRIVSPYAVY